MAFAGEYLGEYAVGHFRGHLIVAADMFAEQVFDQTHAGDHWK